MMISDEPARQAVHLREDEVPLLHEVALDGIVRQVLVGFGQTLAALSFYFSQRLRRAAGRRRGRHGGHRFRVKQPRRECATVTLAAALGVKREQQAVYRGQAALLWMDRGRAGARSEARAECQKQNDFPKELRETY